MRTVHSPSMCSPLCTATCTRTSCTAPCAQPDGTSTVCSQCILCRHGRGSHHTSQVLRLAVLSPCRKSSAEPSGLASCRVAVPGGPYNSKPSPSATAWEEGRALWQNCSHSPQDGSLWQNTSSSSLRGEVLGAGSAVGSDSNFLAGAAGQDVPLQWCDATGRLVPELPVASWLASALPF